MAKAHVDEARAVAESFAISEDHEHVRMRTRPHAHVRHQLLYASRGVLTLLTDAGSWLLPSGRAAFLPAGTVHRVRADGAVSLRTLYVSTKLEGVPRGFSVFVLPSLGKELLDLAMKYEAHAPLDGCGRDTFSLLARLVGVWAASPCPFDLPSGESPEVRKATQVVRADIGAELSAADVAKAAGLSVRSLHRRLVGETGLSFRDYLVRSRVLAAMAALAEPRARITDVAPRVGFESLGAFARAFRKIAGESPSAYRARTQSAR